MSNGHIDDAEVKAILSGGRSEIDAYLVRSVHELTKAVEGMPDMIAEAIADHQAFCRAGTRKRLVAIASAVGAVIGVLTPYIIHWL